MARAKLIMLLSLVILAIVLIQQNTQAVETKLLFVTITMPRAVLLVMTLLIGFASGLLVAIGIGKRRAKRTKPAG